MGSVLEAVVDPSGYFTGDGTPSVQDMLDPGGAAIEKITGSDIGRTIAQIADPVAMLGGEELSKTMMPETPEILAPQEIPTVIAKSEAQRAAQLDAFEIAESKKKRKKKAKSRFKIDRADTTVDVGVNVSASDKTTGVQI